MVRNLFEKYVWLVCFALGLLAFFTFFRDGIFFGSWERKDFIVGCLFVCVWLLNGKYQKEHELRMNLEAAIIANVKARQNGNS
ncbi:MAG: hypothetical protein RLZZ469_1661 [Bacteroidota bacterium]|jgi:hypothetical protein